MNTDQPRPFIYTLNLMPLLGAPIAQTSQTLQTVPLYCGWYLIPSYGQLTLCSPA